jgi:hypothetical protein
MILPKKKSLNEMKDAIVFGKLEMIVQLREYEKKNKLDSEGMKALADELVSLELAIFRAQKYRKSKFKTAMMRKQFYDGMSKIVKFLRGE